MLLTRIIQLAVTGVLLGVACLAQTAVTPQPSPTPNQSSSEDSKKSDRDPIDKADEYKSKLTFSTYFTRGNRAFDLNLRHQLGPVTVWIAGFYDPQSNKLLRTGIQYDYRKAWFHFVPTIEVATTKAVSGSLSFELGSGKTVGKEKRLPPIF